MRLGHITRTTATNSLDDVPAANAVAGGLKGIVDFVIHQKAVAILVTAIKFIPKSFVEFAFLQAPILICVLPLEQGKLQHPVRIAITLQRNVNLVVTNYRRSHDGAQQRVASPTFLAGRRVVALQLATTRYHDVFAATGLDDHGYRVPPQHLRPFTSPDRLAGVLVNRQQEGR